MKFGHEYGKALATEGFPPEWLESAIDYKNLKKCIAKVQKEIGDLGLTPDAVARLSRNLDVERHTAPASAERHDFVSAEEPQLATIREELAPQLRVLVDKTTGAPLDATLTPATREALQKLAQPEVAAEDQAHAARHATHDVHLPDPTRRQHARANSTTPVPEDAKWIQLPLHTAKEFFDLLAPKLDELERLREAETRKLEEDILDLGDAVENVVQPVREGYEATRTMSYRDLYFWRELFRRYLENPVFYSATEQNRGAISYDEAKARLEAFNAEIRRDGLLAKMKSAEAQLAAQKFLDVNVEILKIMHFQEMNSEAMRKILKKFTKRTNLELEGREFTQELMRKYPALLPAPHGTHAGALSFTAALARDLNAEMTTKVLSIVPQIDDWACPVCYEMAWRPVSLGCCRSIFCIRCVIKLQADNVARCPTCNSATVARADGRNIDFEAMDFLEKFFPLEVKKRQKQNEKEDLQSRYGEHFTRDPACVLM